MKKAVVVAGGSGLVGRELIKILGNRSDVEVTSLVRTPSQTTPPQVREVPFDFTQPREYGRLGTEIPCEIFFCCLGTTLRKAGSPEAFRAVDRDLPIAFLERLRRLPHLPTFAFVSSVGADKPRGLYLKTKWEVEEAMRQSGLPAVVVRPSLLLGARAEFRPGERLATLLAPPMFDLIFAFTKRPPQFLARYAPIEAHQVASALVHYTLDEPSPGRAFEGRALIEV